MFKYLSLESKIPEIMWGSLCRSVYLCTNCQLIWENCCQDVACFIVLIYAFEFAFGECDLTLTLWIAPYAPSASACPHWSSTWFLASQSASLSNHIARGCWWTWTPPRYDCSKYPTRSKQLAEHNACRVPFKVLLEFCNQDGAQVGVEYIFACTVKAIVFLTFIKWVE